MKKCYALNVLPIIMFLALRIGVQMIVKVRMVKLVSNLIKLFIIILETWGNK